MYVSKPAMQQKRRACKLKKVTSEKTALQSEWNRKGTG